MNAHTTRWIGAGMPLMLALALAACGQKDGERPGAAPSPDANLPNADYGGPPRVGVPSDEAGGTATSTAIEVRVVAVDPKAPSITARPAGPSDAAPEPRTIPVQATAAASLQTVKAGDLVTVMCATAAGAAPGGLEECAMVLDVVGGRAPAGGGR